MNRIIANASIGLAVMALSFGTVESAGNSSQNRSNSAVSYSASQSNRVTLKGRVVNLKKLVSSNLYNTRVMSSDMSSRNQVSTNGSNTMINRGSSYNNNSTGNSSGSNYSGNNNINYNNSGSSNIQSSSQDNMPVYSTANRFSYQSASPSNVNTMHTGATRIAPLPKDAESVPDRGILGDSPNDRIPRHTNTLAPDDQRSMRFTGRDNGMYAYIQRNRVRIAERNIAAAMDAANQKEIYADSYAPGESNLTPIPDNTALMNDNTIRIATLSPSSPMEDQSRSNPMMNDNSNSSVASGSMINKDCDCSQMHQGISHSGINDNSARIGTLAPESPQNGSAISSTTGSKNNKNVADADKTKVAKSKKAIKNTETAKKTKTAFNKSKAAKSKSSVSTGNSSTVATPYGFMVSTGSDSQVYLVVNKDGTLANKKLAKYANRDNVNIEGTVSDINGLKVIYLDKIEAER